MLVDKKSRLILRLTADGVGLMQGAFLIAGGAGVVRRLSSSAAAHPGQIGHRTADWKHRVGILPDPVDLLAEKVGRPKNRRRPRSALGAQIFLQPLQV